MRKAIAAPLTKPLPENEMQGVSLKDMVLLLATVEKLSATPEGVRMFPGKACPVETLKGFTDTVLYAEDPELVNSSENTAPSGRASQSLAMVQLLAPLFE
jgi:hypothetical protein